MVLLEQNDKLGFYMVGPNKHYIKPQALIDSTRSGHFPEWNFNRDVFGNFNWQHEPALAIQELYRIRAQQLRDQYDYIRLEVSGGGDSARAVGGPDRSCSRRARGEFVWCAGRAEVVGRGVVVPNIRCVRRACRTTRSVPYRSVRPGECRCRERRARRS